MGTATIVIIVIVAALAVGGIGAAIFFLSGGATGDCVYTFEGRVSRFPNYSEAECDQYCAGVQFGGCFFEPYVIQPT